MFCNRSCFVATGVLAVITTLGSIAHAELIYGVTDSSDLVSFDSATPGNLTTIGAFSGILTGHTVRGIDFRPATGQIYALSTTTPNAAAGTVAQLYTTNLITGVLTTVGSSFTLRNQSGINAIAALDFNPVDDTIRIVTGSGLNYRFDPVTGAMISRDTDINTSDVITNIAYSNNSAGATSATLYAYDYSTNVIGTIGNVGGSPTSPNTGQFIPIGSSNVLTSTSLGFDISGATGIAYVNANAAGAGPNDILFQVSLATGRMNVSGYLGVPMRDIFVRPVVVPEPATFVLMLPVCLGIVLRRRRK